MELTPTETNATTEMARTRLPLPEPEMTAPQQRKMVGDEQDHSHDGHDHDGHDHAGHQHGPALNPELVREIEVEVPPRKCRRASGRW